MNAFRVVAVLTLLVAGVFGCKDKKATSVAQAPVETTSHSHVAGDPQPAPNKPKLTNLLKERLAEHEDLEVIVSKVEVPPNTELPKHYHPGQEFVYVVEGSATIAVDGEPERSVGAGEAAVVPARAHHRAWTGKDGATVIAFRVHDPEKPVRYLIGPDGKEVPAPK